MLWLSFLWLQVFAQWLTQSRNSLTIPWIIDKFLKVKSCPKSSNRIIQTYQKFIHQKCFIQSSQFEREHIPSWCDHCLKHFGNANFEILSQPVAHFFGHLQNWKIFVLSGGGFDFLIMTRIFEQQVCSERASVIFGLLLLLLRKIKANTQS